MTPATQALLEANLDLALLDYAQEQARSKVMSDPELHASIKRDVLIEANPEVMTRLKSRREQRLPEVVRRTRGGELFVVIFTATRHLSLFYLI